MTLLKDTLPARIGSSGRTHAPLGLGGTTFSPTQWSGQDDADLLAAMQTSLDAGITHFDTASGYGNGYSERLIGRFLSAETGRRDRVFLASKASLNEISAAAILSEIDGSRQRLQSDVIDLYYIHWPRTGKDLRPLMDGLETARSQGKIGAVGVSNFSVAQMEQLMTVGRIDAHQMGYHLLWRFPERDVIPFCAAHGIAVVTYASLAHGILVGKLPRRPEFPEGDQRRIISLLRPDVWKELYEPVAAMKAVAERTGRPLAHLAIRWLLHRSTVTAVLVSARNAKQAAANAQALDGSIDESVFAELTAISDRAMPHVPDEGNPYGYHP